MNTDQAKRQSMPPPAESASSSSVLVEKLSPPGIIIPTGRINIRFFRLISTGLTILLIISIVSVNRGDTSTINLSDLLFPFILSVVLGGLQLFELFYMRGTARNSRLISEVITTAIRHWDITSDQLRWGGNLQRKLGYTPDRIGKDSSWWEERIHPHDREEVLDSLRRAQESESHSWLSEYRFQRLDGSYAAIDDRSYIQYNALGTPVRMVSAMLDISEQHAAREKLRKEHNLLRTLIDQLPDNIFAKDLESRFIMANPAVARVMGVDSPEDLLGKTDKDFYPADLAEVYMNDEKVLMQSGDPLIDHEEPVIDLRSQTERWYSTMKIPIQDKNGTVTGLVGIGRDITQRKQAEDALQEANRKQSSWIADLERQSQEIALLNEMSDLLLTCPTIEEAYSVISDVTLQLFPRESGSLYMTSASRNIVEIVASWGEDNADPPVFEPNDCWGLRLGRMHVVEKTTKAARGHAGTSGLMCGHIHEPLPDAYICVPLVAQGEALGFLHIRQTHDQAADNPEDIPTEWFDEKKQQLAHSVAFSLALALANLNLRETLRRQSIRDQLTGMFNRRYMEESVEREVRRLARIEKPLGVIMIDIDHFKQFNDTYGHDAGDTVLREMGIYFRSHVREEDIPCRYGGEEFALILPDASLEITCQRAEKLREGVKHLNLHYRSQPLGNVTVSLGVSVFPDHGFTGEAVINAADKALYYAKQTGRDRVVVADSY